MDKLKDTLEDLSITKDEIKKLSDAFKNEEFRKLFREYAEELQDPENRRKYEEELTAMENERGMDVEFINPEPGHVLKTIQNGDKKIFVNLCCSTKIEPAKIVPSSKGGKSGTQWSIPHSFSPPREDIDKKKDACLVYDVVFNPTTYQQSLNDLRFRQMLHDTALQGIETNFHVKVDQSNVRVLKLKMKGQPTASVIRRKRSDYNARQEDLLQRDDGPLTFPYPDDGQETEKKEYEVTQMTDTTVNEYSRPKYTVKYSDEFDVANYVGEQVIHTARPKKLIVEVSLPLVSSANSVDLDIDDKRMTLTTEKPVKYKLELKFTYPIMSEKGTAKFDKSKRMLKLELPIVQIPEPALLTMDYTTGLTEAINDKSKTDLIDDSFSVIEDAEKISQDNSECEPTTVDEERDEKIASTEVEKERKTVNVPLRYRTTGQFAFIVCDIKNVNMDSVNIIYHTAKDGCQMVSVNFSTCGQGGWQTCYTLPLTVGFSGSASISTGYITCRVARDNITLKVPRYVGSDQVSTVTSSNQIMSLERRDEFCDWRNIELPLEGNEQKEEEEEEENCFNVAYCNVNKDVLKIVCVSLDQEIDFAKEFPMEIEVIGEKTNDNEDMYVNEVRRNEREDLQSNAYENNNTEDREVNENRTSDREDLNIYEERINKIEEIEDLQSNEYGYNDTVDVEVNEKNTSDTEDLNIDEGKSTTKDDCQGDMEQTSCKDYINVNECVHNCQYKGAEEQTGVINDNTDSRSVPQNVSISKMVNRQSEVEGLIPGEYFEERRNPVHRTHCAVDLDEKLLFDLE